MECAVTPHGVSEWPSAVSCFGSYNSITYQFDGRLDEVVQTCLARRREALARLLAILRSRATNGLSFSNRAANKNIRHSSRYVLLLLCGLGCPQLLAHCANVEMRRQYELVGLDATGAHKRVDYVCRGLHLFLFRWSNGFVRKK